MTATRKAHDIKGGDHIRVSRSQREVFDAYPNSGTTYVIRYYTGRGTEVVSMLVPTDSSVETS